MEIQKLSGIFDSHAHYDDPRFEADREEVLRRIHENGVEAVINAGCDAETSYKGLALARRYPWFWAAAGIHPEMAGEVEGAPSEDGAEIPGWLAPIDALLFEEKVVAVGEIGLDYHYDTPPREQQKRVFEAQLQLAVRRDLPVIVHSRDAAEDTLCLLKKYPVQGVLHCFSGSVETAGQVLALGMYIGLTGVVTFSNARRAREVAAMVPLDRLLLETDCPYMAPVPHRGSRCTSDMIACTAQAIAQCRGITAKEVVDAAAENTRRLFRIEGGS